MMYEKKIGTCQILLFSFLKRAAYVLVVPESCARWLKITMAISFTLSFLSVRGLRPLGSKREKKFLQNSVDFSYSCVTLVCATDKSRGGMGKTMKRESKLLTVHWYDCPKGKPFRYGFWYMFHSATEKIQIEIGGKL